MSCAQLSEGAFQVVYPPGLWSRSSGVVNVLTDMASKLFTFTFYVYIRVRHLRLREYVEHDEMEVQCVGTKEMLADGFAKTLPGSSLSDLSDKTHLRKS